MNKPKKYKEKNKSAEPASSYFSGRKMRFFHSFEEENEATYKDWAETSPEEHIIHTVNLIRRIYSQRTAPEQDNMMTIIHHE